VQISEFVRISDKFTSTPFPSQAKFYNYFQVKYLIIWLPELVSGRPSELYVPEYLIFTHV